MVSDPLVSLGGIVVVRIYSGFELQSWYRSHMFAWCLLILISQIFFWFCIIVHLEETLYLFFPIKVELERPGSDPIPPEGLQSRKKFTLLLKLGHLSSLVPRMLLVRCCNVKTLTGFSFPLESLKLRRWIFFNNLFQRGIFSSNGRGHIIRLYNVGNERWIFMADSRVMRSDYSTRTMRMQWVDVDLSASNGIFLNGILPIVLKRHAELTFLLPRIPVSFLRKRGRCFHHWNPTRYRLRWCDEALIPPKGLQSRKKFIFC